MSLLRIVCKNFFPLLWTLSRCMNFHQDSYQRQHRTTAPWRWTSRMHPRCVWLHQDWVNWIYLIQSKDVWAASPLLPKAITVYPWCTVPPPNAQKKLLTTRSWQLNFFNRKITKVAWLATWNPYWILPKFQLQPNQPQLIVMTYDIEVLPRHISCQDVWCSVASSDIKSDWYPNVVKWSEEIHAWE